MDAVSSKSMYNPQDKFPEFDLNSSKTIRNPQSEPDFSWQMPDNRDLVSEKSAKSQQIKTVQVLYPLIDKMKMKRDQKVNEKKRKIVDKHGVVR